MTSREPSKRKNKNQFDVLSQLDSLDMKIIEELISNANISSSAIAEKHNIPLSTIQRRRAILESKPILKHEYRLDSHSFSLRPVEFWVMVEKGNAHNLAQNIFEKYHNVSDIFQQMNSISNLGIRAYVKSTEQLYSMLEQIKSMAFVKNVEYAEVIKVTHTRQVNFVKLLHHD